MNDPLINVNDWKSRNEAHLTELQKHGGRSGSGTVMNEALI
jgi:hypothetical protein